MSMYRRYQPVRRIPVGLNQAHDGFCLLRQWKGDFYGIGTTDYRSFSSCRRTASMELRRNWGIRPTGVLGLILLIVLILLLMGYIPRGFLSRAFHDGSE